MSHRIPGPDIDIETDLKEISFKKTTIFTFLTSLCIAGTGNGSRNNTLPGMKKVL